VNRKPKTVLTTILTLAILLTAWLTPITPAQANPIPDAEINVTWLIPPTWDFDLVVNFYGGIAAVEILEDYGWIHVLGYIDTTGEVVIPIDYRHPEPHYFYRGAPRFTYGAGGIYCTDRGGVAFFDVAGRQLTGFDFNDAYDFSEGLAATSAGHWETGIYWGFVDTQGNVAIPFNFDYAGPFSEGLASVRQGAWGDGRWGFIDRTGNMVIPFNFEAHRGWLWGHVPVFSEGRAVVWQEDRDHPNWAEYHDEPPGLWAFIDRDGNQITPFIYSQARPFSQGLAAVSTGGWEEGADGNWADTTQWGFINLSGDVVVPPMYRTVGNFSEGLAFVAHDLGWGFIDQTGTEVIPLQFVNARNFSEGRAAVDFAGAGWGFIDREGNHVIPTSFDHVNDFSQGLAAVRVGDWATGRWGYIDRMGNTVVAIELEDARDFQEGLAWAKQGGLWGVLQIVDHTAPEETPPQEDEPVAGLYIHQPTPPQELFNPASQILGSVNTPASAQWQIRDTVSGLTPSQRTSGEGLNIATLQIENIARRGTTQPAPADGNFSESMLRGAATMAQGIQSDTEAILVEENMTLLRHIRTNINFTSEDDGQITAAFPDGVSDIPFDNITVESDFAAVTLNREHIPHDGAINIRRVEAAAPATPANGESDETGTRDNGGTANIEPESGGGFLNHVSRLREEISDFSSLQIMLRNLWSVVVIVVLLLTWLIIAALGERLRRWVVPAIAIIAIAVNMGLVMLRINNDAPARAPGANAWHTPENDNQATHPLYTGAVEVTMTEGMRATLSMPTNGHNPEFLVIANETGEVMHSRYNPVTGNIDARIRTGGTYTLRENQVNFADIQNQSQLMQHAIRQLASRGIMEGTVEGHFHPNDTISRIDMVTTIISAFDMLDTDAVAAFADISPQAWYYLAIATAKQAGLIEGFEDNTFRGAQDIPKDQLVVISANTLIQQMGYHTPADIEYFLSRFLDRNMIATWSQDGIALATATNVLIHRTDSLFAPQSVMTRGDAAIVLYRVFSRVW